MTVAERALDFSLPPELEAHEPPEARGLRRDQVRLLVSSRGQMWIAPSKPDGRIVPLTQPD